MTAPLAGLKVVDFSKFLPGPYCSWMLADLGADVVRIENPRELAKQRKVFGWDRLPREEQDALRARDILARNKRSVLLDPGAERARSAILKLVEQSDVLLEDYRPGVMDSMGYGAEAMQALNPRLIYCSVTLCGQTGPLARKPGHDPVALALAGALSRIGEDPQRPAFPGVPVADLLTGSNAVIAILAAVIARSATGRGQRLDVAMSDSSLALVANILSRHPDPAKPPPKGMARADSGIWQTADGRWLVTTDMEPAYWRRFCDAVGLPELADRQMDRAAWPEMKERIAARMAQRSLGDWLRILGEADTQFAPVHSVAEAMAEPHHLERGAIVDVPLPGGGTMAQPATPIRLSDTPAVPPTAAAPAGRDTADVLAELGLSDAEIAQIMEESR